MHELSDPEVILDVIQLQLDRDLHRHGIVLVVPSRLRRPRLRTRPLVLLMRLQACPADGARAEHMHATLALTQPHHPPGQHSHQTNPQRDAQAHQSADDRCAGSAAARGVGRSAAEVFQGLPPGRRTRRAW